MAALRDERETVNDKALVLSDTLAECQAKIDALDARLNHLASRLHKAILTITHDNRNRSLFLRYFGAKDISDLKRPVLGAELEAMTSFIPSLTTSEHGALKELGVELDPLAAEASLAAKQKKLVEQEQKDFQTVGDKKKFIDKLNALRKQLYGELGKLAHEITELPTNFADQFFLRGESRADADDCAATTIEGVEAEITVIEGTLAERKELLEQL
jgi:hypothetical protein